MIVVDTCAQDTSVLSAALAESIRAANRRLFIAKAHRDLKHVRCVGCQDFDDEGGVWFELEEEAGEAEENDDHFGPKDSSEVVDLRDSLPFSDDIISIEDIYENNDYNDGNNIKRKRKADQLSSSSSSYHNYNGSASRSNINYNSSSNNYHNSSCYNSSSSSSNSHSSSSSSSSSNCSGGGELKRRKSWLENGVEYLTGLLTFPFSPKFTASNRTSNSATIDLSDSEEVIEIDASPVAVDPGPGPSGRLVCCPCCGTQFCLYCKTKPYHFHCHCNEQTAYARAWLDWASSGRYKALLAHVAFAADKTSKALLKRYEACENDPEAPETYSTHTVLILLIRVSILLGG